MNKCLSGQRKFHCSNVEIYCPSAECKKHDAIRSFETLPAKPQCGINRQLQTDVDSRFLITL